MVVGGGGVVCATAPLHIRRRTTASMAAAPRVVYCVHTRPWCSSHSVTVKPVVVPGVWWYNQVTVVEASNERLCCTNTTAATQLQCSTAGLQFFGVPNHLHLKASELRPSRCATAGPAMHCTTGQQLRVVVPVSKVRPPPRPPTLQCTVSSWAPARSHTVTPLSASRLAASPTSGRVVAR